MDVVVVHLKLNWAEFSVHWYLYYTVFMNKSALVSLLVHSVNKSAVGSYSKLPSPPLLLRPFNTCALSNSGRPQQQQQEEEREATETIKSRNSRNLILNLSTSTTTVIKTTTEDHKSNLTS